MMAEFVSTYREVNYKIPETADKHAKFSDGRLQTNDEQVVSYLRQHRDFGNTLTEIEHPDRKSMTVGVCICEVCGKVFDTKAQLTGHMRVHKGGDLNGDT
jgi:hypothetical protein